MWPTLVRFPATRGFLSIDECSLGGPWAQLDRPGHFCNLRAWAVSCPLLWTEWPGGCWGASWVWKSLIILEVKIKIISISHDAQTSITGRCVINDGEREGGQGYSWESQTEQGRGRSGGMTHEQPMGCWGTLGQGRGWYCMSLWAKQGKWLTTENCKSLWFTNSPIDQYCRGNSAHTWVARYTQPCQLFIGNHGRGIAIARLLTAGGIA